MDEEINTIKEMTLVELQNAGYEAYDVNPSTFESVESALKTDLRQMGLDEKSSYIVVVSGDPNAEQVTAPIVEVPPDPPDGGNSFYYTYNGEKLKMRFLTVLPSEDRDFTLETTKLIVNGRDSNFLEKIADALFYFFIDEMPGSVLGTLLSLTDLDELIPGEYYIYYTARSCWTRRYTQIYEERLDMWYGWSGVEYVAGTSWTTGHWYDINGNESYINDDNSIKALATHYSEHYNDLEWQKHECATARYFSFFRGESVATARVYYSWRGETVVSHNSPVWP